MNNGKRTIVTHARCMIMMQYSMNIPTPSAHLHHEYVPDSHHVIKRQHVRKQSIEPSRRVQYRIKTFLYHTSRLS